MAELPSKIETTTALQGQVGQVLVNENIVSVTGLAATGQVGSVSFAPRFDSTSITLDSTTDTFDEG